MFPLPNLTVFSGFYITWSLKNALGWKPGLCQSWTKLVCKALKFVCPSLLSLFKNVLLLNAAHETKPKKSALLNEPMLLHASLIFQKKCMTSVNSLSRFLCLEVKSLNSFSNSIFSTSLLCQLHHQKYWNFKL